MRAKRVPVFQTDKEKDESEIMHLTIRSQCETEDSHKCLPKRVASATSDHGSLAHDVYMDPVLIQKIHSAVGTCQVPHESTETRAVNVVLENLDTCGLDEVLLKRDVGSVIRILVNPAWVGRGEKDDGREEFEVFASVNGVSENAVKGTETSVITSDCELPEWSGCKVNSESIAPS